MNCPKCIDKIMEPFTAEGVEFDFCVQKDGCLGLWCEKGELAFYLESGVDLPFNKVTENAVESQYSCPKCNDQKLFHIQYDKQLESPELDFCKNCHGIFVDKGEMHKLEASAARIPLKERLNYLKTELDKKGYKIF